MASKPSSTSDEVSLQPMAHGTSVLRSVSKNARTPLSSFCTRPAWRGRRGASGHKNLGGKNLFESAGSRGLASSFFSSSSFCLASLRTADGSRAQQNTSETTCRGTPQREARGRPTRARGARLRGFHAHRLLQHVGRGCSLAQLVGQLQPRLRPRSRRLRPRSPRRGGGGARAPGGDPPRGPPAARPQTRRWRPSTRCPAAPAAPAAAAGDRSAEIPGGRRLC